MKNNITRMWLLCAFALAIALNAAISFAAVDPKASELLNRLTNSSLAFTANMGQFPDHILYRASVPNATIWVTKTGMQYQFTRVTGERIDPMTAELSIPDGLSKTSQYEQLVIATKLKGADQQPYAVGQNMLDGYSNYFLGNDHSKWVTDVPDYSSVALYGVYPGVDVYYYGAQGKIEYDFFLAPGADPSLIQIEYEGVKSLQIAENGDLEITTDWSTITQHKPVVYQEQNGVRIPLDAQYALIEPNVVGFKLPKTYNPALALVIDPVITYGSYVGGSSSDVGWDVAVDNCENAYLAGYTASTSFPTSGGAYQTSYGGGNLDVFVAKLNTRDSGAGSRVWITYLGGSSGDPTQAPVNVAIDASNNVYVGGATNSSNFPITTGAYDSTYGGNNDIFVTKLSSSGSSLGYSTYIGGNGIEALFGLAVDINGQAYITGEVLNQSTPGGYPYVKGYEQKGNMNYSDIDVICSKLNSSGTALLYSTYLGGTDVDYGYGIAVDTSEHVYVVGPVNSSNFDTKNAYDSTHNSGPDAFLAIFDTRDSFAASLDYSTYFGGAGGEAGIAVSADNAGMAYIVGECEAGGGDIPISNAYQASKGGNIDAFLTKIDPSLGSSGLIYSTYFGGVGNEDLYDIALDSLNHPVIVGRSDSTGWPAVNAIDGSYNSGGRDIVIAQFYDGDSVLFSSYLGGSGYDAGYGIAIDHNQSFYVAAKSTTSGLFSAPVLDYDESINGDSDAVVIKIVPNWDTTDCQPGDVDNNGTIDRNDVLSLTSYTNSGVPVPPCTSGRINNCSATINFQDIITLVNYVISCGAIGCSSCSCP